MVKNLPTNANARDTGLIPDLGRPHMPRSNWPCVPPLLSLCSRTQELQQEKPLQWEAHTLQLQKSPRSNKDPAQPKINKIIWNFFLKKDPTYHNKLFYMCVCVCVCVYFLALPSRVSLPVTEPRPWQGKPQILTTRPLGNSPQIKFFF